MDCLGRREHLFCRTNDDYFDCAMTYLRRNSKILSYRDWCVVQEVRVIDELAIHHKSGIPPFTKEREHEKNDLERTGWNTGNFMCSVTMYSSNTGSSHHLSQLCSLKLLLMLN